MNESKNEIEFVELKGCFDKRCDYKTDLFCVSCDKWLCWNHKSVCVQCEQLVCEECYKEDLCCLVRPWGEKTERYLRDFYQNKFVDRDGMYLFNDKMKYGNKYRMEAVKRTIEDYVDNFDASLGDCEPEYVRDYFPSITKYVENDKIRRKFVTFMSKLFRLRWYVFSPIFFNNDVREDLLTVMDDSIRSNEKMQSDLIEYALESKELFESLKSRKLLGWKSFRTDYCTIEHIDAMKWVEQNGVDVVNNEKHFDQFVRFSPAEIMEYLIVEKGMTVEYMSKNISYVTLDILRMVYRLKGIEGIQKIDPTRIKYDFESAKFLRSIGYKFNKEEINSVWIYAILCLKVIKYEDLNEYEKENFNQYVNIKACKHLYPFMKEIRKKKLMTVILCILKTCTLQKEIVWNILDLAYSPINERGSL